MSPLVIKKIFFTFVIFSFQLALVGCTLYESAGREAIKKNSGGIVRSSGYDIEFKNYFSCSAQKTMPSSLKNDLLLIESPVEAEGYSVMATGPLNPRWIYVYLFDEAEQVHYTCYVQSLEEKTIRKTSNLIYLGVIEIEKLHKK